MGATNAATSGGRSDGIVGTTMVCCMHWFPNVVALMMPVYLAMGWGSCRRSFPTLRGTRP